MRLMHFSHKPVGELYDVEQQLDNNNMGKFAKPKGLWISDENDHGWQTWCKEEDFCTDRLTHPYKVFLKKDANILYLRNEEDIDKFTEQYKLKSKPITRHLLSDDFNFIKQINELMLESNFNDGIDWITVAEKYDGIIITPYIWKRRLNAHTSWYYGWDCASGCIWRPSKAIEKITLVKENLNEETNV